MIDFRFKRTQKPIEAFFNDRLLIRDYTHWRAKIDRFALLTLLFFTLGGCSGIERSENEKIRRRNCKGEPIYRAHDEYSYAIQPPKHTPRALYPWERPTAKLTKEFFRCKGDSSHPPLSNPEDPANPLCDCEARRHGLPVIHGQEGVYPILLELLNYLQENTGKKVIITCGHRCPKHNSYSDPSKENLLSKHQIGAEVDFYVQGLEDKPLEVINLLLDYYKNRDSSYAFRRYEKADARSSTQPWMNKEVFIQLFQAHEGRDGDNNHPYPYISIQVRYDRDSQEKVIYEWKKAHLGYPRG